VFGARSDGAAGPEVGPSSTVALLSILRSSPLRRMDAPVAVSRPRARDLSRGNVGAAKSPPENSNAPFADPHLCGLESAPRKQCQDAPVRGVEDRFEWTCRRQI